MIELKYENVNPCKLQDELIASGLIAGSFITFDLGNDTAQIQFNDDVDIKLVESVVSKHDKSPIPTPKTEMEIAQEQLFNTQTELLQSKQNNNDLGQQLFNAQTELIQREQENNNLGSQLFNLQTTLMMNGVIK